MANNEEELAGRLYAVYCRAVGGKAFNGDALPTWDEFRVDLKKLAQSNAWRAVAREAIAAETGVESAPLLTVKKTAEQDPETVELDFSNTPNPGIVAQFMLDLIRGMAKSPEILQRVNDAGLDGSPEEIYRRLNAGGHPVRDGLILLGHSLLTPKPFKRPEGPFWLFTDNGDGERWHLCQIMMSPQGNVMKPMLQYLTEDFEDYWYDEDWCPEEIAEITPPKD